MNVILTPPLPGTVPDPKYPESDGRFMGETDYHNIALIRLREALEDHFDAVPDVYIASNLILYYKEGDPSKRKDPDILVAKKVVGKHKRRFFRTWEEKAIPRVLWELASRKTWRVDLHKKRWLYARIGVREYFLFDPHNLYLNPPLRGFRLVNGKSTPIKPNTDGSLTSRELGLRFLADGDNLRIFDVKTGQEILSLKEQRERERLRADAQRDLAQAEKQLAQAEKRRADAQTALAQAERERAQAEKARANAQTERADAQTALAQAERLRTEAERERAELEKKRADELQAEVDKLRRRLRNESS